MSDRVLIPFGDCLLALSLDAFGSALRDGAAIAKKAPITSANPGADSASEALRRPLLTPSDAARMLAVDATWLLRQAREGRIPHIRLGKYVRFDADDIARQCTIRPKAAP